MDRIALQAQPRTVLGKKVRFLRRQGVIPVNVFGHAVESEALQVDALALQKAMSRAGTTALIDLRVEGILLTMADTRAALTRDVQTAVEQQYGDGIHIYNAVIRRSVRFAESAAAGRSILAHDPRGPGANAYRTVAKEIDKGKN